MKGVYIIIQIVSNKCARYLGTKVPNTKYPSVEDQLDAYEYGIMFILGALVKGFLLVATAYLLGVLIPALILTLTFSSFRIIAGGYHASSFGKCMIFSISQYIIGALITQYTYHYWSEINIWVLLSICWGTGIYVIYKYAPRDTPNKVIDEISEIAKLKLFSLLYLMFWATVMIICLIFDVKIVIIASSFGLLLELFSISELGNRFYRKIES